MDHGPWQRVLDTYRHSSGRVHYAGLQQSEALKPYVSGLASATEPIETAAKMAFWLNAYNALTVDLIADNWPVQSIRDLHEGKVWTTKPFTVAGETMTLDQLENEKLKPLGDPRTHFALNCASLGCPPLSPKAFNGPDLEKQLNYVTRSWVPGKGVLIDKKNKRLMMSPLFQWYAADFKDPGGAPIPGISDALQGPVKHAALHVPAVDARWMRSGGYTIGFYSFSWSVNAVQ